MPPTALTMAMAALLATALWASPVWGRFSPDDADRLDPEERYGTETFNDKLSYRFPLLWEELWDSRPVGYRVSAGSLDVKRFDYLEDLKLRVEGDQGLALSFRQERREDTVEQRTARELRLATRLGSSPWRADLLADGGTFKEYGDLGLALGLSLGPRSEVEATYWSVDHYYDTKKSEPRSERRGEPDAWGLRVDTRWGADWRLRADYEFEQPFTWIRPSLGYEYAYARTTARLRLDGAVTPETRWFASSSFERKDEAKTWLSEDGAALKKTLSRRAGEAELGLVQGHTEGTLGAGVVFWTRDAQSDSMAESKVEPRPDGESSAPPRSRRREGAAYATWHQPLASARHYLQSGLYWNEVRLAEDRAIRASEVKAQLAWDHVLSHQARLLVNTTWDLDELQRDFPFDKRPFRPWGGGNLQFIAVF